MKKRLLPLVASITFFSFQANASHITGGEMSYQYLGNNNYEITLKLFRDCFNGIPMFDNPAYIGVYDGSNNLVTTLTVMLAQDDTIPLSMACGGVAVNICAEQGIYVDTVSLPPSSGGYTLAYQRCCRSVIIENIFDPTNVGMTVYETIPDPIFALHNSSPVFNNYPPTAFCVGIPVYYDDHATDADGDSLVYELCNGLQGADNANPMPIPAMPPPYDDVVYSSPYSGLYPFDANPSLAINAGSGLITGTPSSVGIFSLAVCAKEYRNGVLVGTHRRELSEVYTVLGLPTGLDASSNDAVSIYPNPATNELVINISSPGINAVKIFDEAGKLIVQQETVKDESATHVDLNNFPNGIYFIELISDNGSSRKKFIVHR